MLGFSQNICMDCKHDLQQFYNFREMCITTDENIRSSRRPTSRNNEHDYSTLNDDYVDDMDLSQYLINSTLNHIEGSDPDLKYDAEQLTVEPHIDEQPPEPPVFDETQNFDAPQNKYVPKRYACPICHKLWVSPSKLKRHMTVHSNDRKPNSMQLAAMKKRGDTKVKTLTELKTFKQSEVKQEPAEDSTCSFLCLVCGLELPTQSRLQNHMNVQHLSGMEDYTSNLTKKPKVEPKRGSIMMHLTCYECKKTFENGNKLKRHLRTHDSARNNMPRPRRHGE